MQTAEALQAGIHQEVLYYMRDTGLLETLARGLYRLADAPALGNPDLVTIGLKVPKGVICLISALSFHELTTQIPHAVDVALVRGSEKPRIDYPPIHVYWTVQSIFKIGIDVYKLDGHNVQIYNAERTLVDCFRQRNKLGLDTAMEAVRLYRERKQVNSDMIMEYARLCRVESTIRPYLEAIL